MFTAPLIAAIRAEAAALGVAPAALAAIVSVESGGRVTALVAGRDEPLIRFEGHWFDRLLSPKDRTRARAAGLADPRPGGVANPADQAARWALLARAIAIDRDAALASASWGVGQVMGLHWRRLGYASVDALVSEARQGPPGQVRLLARYIAATGLADALGRHDWAAFSRGYNGPAFRTHAYDRRLAEAFARLAGDPVFRTDGGPVDRAQARPPPGTAERRVIRPGDRGTDVTDLQRRLTALGHFAAADGVFGAATEAALRAFQSQAGLAADGVCGPATRLALALAHPAAGFAARLRRGLAALRARLGI